MSDDLHLYALIAAEALDAADLSDDPQEQARQRQIAERYLARMKRVRAGEDADDELERRAPRSAGLSPGG